MDEFVLYKSVTLKQLKVGLNFKVSPEVEIDDLNRLICYRITGYVWSQDAGKKEVFKYPADWWQALKERWFPRWLLKRFPVVYTYKEFIVKATYPDLVVQNHEPVLRLLSTTYDGIDFKDRI
jgi:hypothetical protein